MSGGISKKSGGGRDELLEHYRVEKELADILRNAPREERGRLYPALYDELYRRLPGHSQLRRKSSPESAGRAARARLKLLRRYIGGESTFVETGAGACALSLLVSGFVKRVYAIDVSREIAGDVAIPGNMRLLISDGLEIPVPEGSADAVFSDQLAEHLHTDDLVEHLKNVYRCLAPGGTYICLTPNRLNGPHDISKYFTEIATGFHLKEYTNSELGTLFRDSGFVRIRALVGARGYYLPVPVSFPVFIERALSVLPRRAGRGIAGTLLFRILLGIRIAGMKDRSVAAGDRFGGKGVRART